MIKALYLDKKPTAESKHIDVFTTKCTVGIRSYPEPEAKKKVSQSIRRANRMIVD
jgi:hypothetical protein